MQTAHDVKLQLKWIAEGISQPAITTSAAPKRRKVQRFWMIACALLLAVAAFVTFLYLRRPPDNVRLSVFTIPPPKGSSFMDIKEADSTFQPGGTTVLSEVFITPTTVVSAKSNYVAAADGQKFLVSAFIDDVASKPITMIQNWPALLKK